jgi:hypothetical protein
MISEPVTLATDYALAALNLLFAGLVRGRAEGQRARKAWSLAFLALGLGAAFGGTWHGFAPLLPEALRFVLWKATVLCIGVGAAAMMVGSAAATVQARTRRAVTIFAIVTFALYAGWMLTHNAYVFVVVDTAVAMVTVVALHAATSSARAAPGSRWILAAVALSAIAAGAQAGGIELHEHFNHNDLYHVLQMGAMGLFYAGARELRDRP